MPDDDEVAAIADCLDDVSTYSHQPAVLAGEIDGDRLVAVRAQLGRDY